MPTEELFGNYHFLLEVAGRPAGSFLSVDSANTSSTVRGRLAAPRPEKIAGRVAKIESFSLKQKVVEYRKTLDRCGAASLTSALLLGGFQPTPAFLRLAGSGDGSQAKNNVRLLKSRSGHMLDQPAGPVRIVLKQGARTVGSWRFARASLSKLGSRGPNGPVLLQLGSK